MNASCRLLTVVDAPAFQAMRLQAVRDVPEAFLDSYDDLAAKPPEHFSRCFEFSWIVGAFLEGRIVGISALRRHAGRHIAHKGTVWGVYVSPEARGRQLARKMIEMVLQEAVAAGLELVQLSTDSLNERTVALYESLGFERYGIERHMLKLPDRYVDDLLMVKWLVR